MKTPFIIFLKAVVFYAVITLPALILPPMYFISMYFVIIYGWFAWALFTVVYLLIERLKKSYDFKTGLLFASVPAAVLLSFQLMEVLGAYEEIWQSGIFLLFPLAAIVSGWVSLLLTRKRTREEQLQVVQTVPGNNDIF